MHRAAPNIYEGGLYDLVDGLWPDLKALAGTKGSVAAYIGNGHAIWEAANANMFSRGETALVLATGQFGLSWANSARAMGIEVEVLDFGKSAPVDMGQVEAVLRADQRGADQGGADDAGGYRLDHSHRCGGVACHDGCGGAWCFVGGGLYRVLGLRRISHG